MKKIGLMLALAGASASIAAGAGSLDDIQLWTGSGTNRAALVIEWSSPESLGSSSVPVPIADKALVWGYRFNGSATGTQMLDAVVAADPRLYVVEEQFWGTYVLAIGYNLKGDGIIGITDGTTTNSFTGGFLSAATVDIDAARPINSGDLYWGGLYGPNWETWNELGDAGGFLFSPNRGTNAYWTAYDTNTPFSGLHGQWEYSQAGLDDLPLTNGSWIGFSVAAGEYEPDLSCPYDLHKHAPPTPDGTYTAYVCDTNDFAIQIVSTNSVYPTAPYNDPLAMLGRPTLKFLNSFGAGAVHRTKIVEAPYGTTPDGSNVITEISSGGQVTVKLGRKVYDDANNPYGIDLIIFGNSFCIGHSTIGDGTDLDSDILTGGLYGHPTTVSVSQDGTNWFAFGNVATLFPDNAYRWDETNHSWTDEQLNPTKPLNPSVYAMNFSGQATANALDQFIGSAGGTGYDLKASGFPWIQYVRVEPQTGTYTVIDAIAAVNPAVVGDELSITPNNLACGITNLAFQKPADSSQNLISVRFHSVSDAAKVGTVGLNDLSSLAPVIGKVSSAYQITLKPVAGDNAVTFCADVGLRAGDGYSGNGNDLRVFQWSGTNWTSRPFTFDSAGNEAVVAGVTNFSAFAIAQIIPPQLNIRPIGNGFGFQFTPVPNCAHVLERSTDLVRWTPIATNTPVNAQSVTLQDAAAPADKAFYRLHLTTP